MRAEDLKIVYDEVSELHRFQQDSINLLYNKLNWILVSDLVFIAAIYAAHHQSILAILCASVSSIIVLVKFQAKVFKSTAVIKDQLKVAGEPNFLESLINKKREALNSNASKLEETEEALKLARYLLVAAIVLELLVLICGHG